MGIRGECETASLYLDDLTGIDIVKASNFTSEVNIRPLDLVRKCFNLAQKEVFQDVLSLLNRKYNNIVESKMYNYAGGYFFYGEIEGVVKIKVSKQDIFFVGLQVTGFEIISDRNLTKTFTIKTADLDEELIQIDLIKGKNIISIDKFTSSEFIEISFDLSDLKLGSRELGISDWAPSRCKPCSQVSGNCDCSTLEVFLDDKLSNKLIGFNLKTNCKANDCEIIEYLKPILDLPLLYKTGIFYLLEAKMSGRINAYLRNTEDSIEQLLTLWMGGYDNAADTRVPSIYWQKVKQVSSQIENAIAKIESPVFTFEGSSTCNQLP
jgi:hypothetical protein